jgi:hypothetical protein
MRASTARIKGFLDGENGGAEDPTGEAAKDALRVNFDDSLKPEFDGSQVTRDVGLPALGSAMRSSD